MRRDITFLFLLFYCLGISQQKIKVLDKETGIPINNAKIIIGDYVNYTNDDGLAEIHIDKVFDNTILVTAPSYEDMNITSNDNEVYLQPRYKEIEEVVIKKFNVYDFISKISNNYALYYNIDNSLYKAKFKDKLFIDNKINSLSISDINIWALDNQFDFRYKNIDKFLQISLDKVRYYKVDNSDINFKKFTNEKAIKSFNTRIFMNGELILLKRGLKDIDIKYDIINEDDEIKKISFESNGSIQKGISFRGVIEINKIDNAISYMEIEQIQDNSIKKYKSDNDNFKLQTKSVKVIYDFYKKNGKYIPSRYVCIQKGIFEHKGIEKDFRRTREIVFSSHKETTKKGLDNKIDISKDIIYYMPDMKTTSNNLLLSTEEQQFINEY